MKRVVGYIAVAVIAISILVFAKDAVIAGMVGLIGLAIVSESND